MRDASIREHPSLRTGALVLSGLAAACGGGPASPETPAQTAPMTADRPEFADLTRIIATRAEELMSHPGVQGVAMGLLEDGRTPCLQILVVARTAELVDALPTSVEGHPVVLVESGEIRPLDEEE